MSKVWRGILGFDPSQAEAARLIQRNTTAHVLQALQVLPSSARACCFKSLEVQGACRSKHKCALLLQTSCRIEQVSQIAQIACIAAGIGPLACHARLQSRWFHAIKVCESVYSMATHADVLQMCHTSDGDVLRRCCLKSRM